MNILLDTADADLVSWGKLPAGAREMATDPGSERFFSAASIGDVVIKAGFGRPDCSLDGGVLRRELLEHRYAELPVFGSHVLALQGLPPLHAKPFDRLLLAQARD